MIETFGLFLRHFKVVQKPNHPVLQFDDAPSSSPLCSLKLPATVPPVQSAGDTRCMFIPINIWPLQAQVLVGSHSGGRGNCEDRSTGGWEDAFKERSQFFKREDIHLWATVARQLESRDGIVEQQLPIDCLSHRGMQYSVYVPHCSSR